MIDVENLVKSGSRNDQLRQSRELLSGPVVPAAVKASYQLLVAAAKSGSVAAMQSLADFIRQGVLPGGEEVAVKWEQRANKAAEARVAQLISRPLPTDRPNQSYKEKMRAASTRAKAPGGGKEAKPEKSSKSSNAKPVSYVPKGITTKILAIEDDAVTCDLIRSCLEPSGFEVITVHGGNEAMSAISKHPDIACVLCDHYMPQLTGLQFIATMRKNHWLEGVPILMVTAARDPEMIRLAKRLGINGWVVKPFEQDTLVGAVARILQLTPEGASQGAA